MQQISEDLVDIFKWESRYSLDLPQPVVSFFLNHFRVFVCLFAPLLNLSQNLSNK